MQWAVCNTCCCRHLSLHHKSSRYLNQIPTSQPFKVYKQEQFKTYWLKAFLILSSILEDGNTSWWERNESAEKAIRLKVPQSAFTAENFHDSSQGQAGYSRYILSHWLASNTELSNVSFWTLLPDFKKIKIKNPCQAFVCSVNKQGSVKSAFSDPWGGLKDPTCNYLLSLLVWEKNILVACSAEERWKSIPCLTQRRNEILIIKKQRLQQRRFKKTSF